MNFEETATVLAKIKLGDNRQIDDKGLVLREWFESIGDLRFEDALEGVKIHRRESSVWITPNHVRINARRARDARERLERRQRPAIERAPITLDRAKLEAETQAAIENYRKAKESNE